MLRSNSLMLCYLTEPAQIAMRELVAVGLDEDLALVMLEQAWPECDLYQIESDSRDGAANGPPSR